MATSPASTTARSRFSTDSIETLRLKKSSLTEAHGPSLSFDDAHPKMERAGYGAMNHYMAESSPAAQSRNGGHGARPVPGRSSHEDTGTPGLTRWPGNNRSRCAPGRRALRHADLYSNREYSPYLPTCSQLNFGSVSRIFEVVHSS